MKVVEFNIIEKSYNKEKDKFSISNTNATTSEYLGNDFYRKMFQLEQICFPGVFDEKIEQMEDDNILIPIVKKIQKIDKVNTKDDEDIKFKIFKHEIILGEAKQWTILSLKSKKRGAALCLIGMSMCSDNMKAFGGTGNIWGLCIHPEFRKNGFGSSLVKQSCIYLMRNGEIPTITVEKYNTEFYEKNGFMQTKELSDGMIAMSMIKDKF